MTSESPRARWQAGQEGTGRMRGLLIQTEGGCSVSLWLQMKQIWFKEIITSKLLHSQQCSVTWGFHKSQNSPGQDVPNCFKTSPFPRNCETRIFLEKYTWNLAATKLSSFSAHKQLCIMWNESDLHFFQEVISHRKITVILPLSVGSITECLLCGDSMTGTARKGKVNRSMVSVLVSDTVRESNSLVSK